MGRLAGELADEFASVLEAVVAEVRDWSPERWKRHCKVHGEMADGTALVRHIAARGQHVAQFVLERSPTASFGTQPHVVTGEVPDPGSPLANLRAAGRACLDAIRTLDDADIERLHRSEIDGEPDVFAASCGLIGHWAHHLPELRADGQNLKPGD